MSIVISRDRAVRNCFFLHYCDGTKRKTSASSKPRKTVNLIAKDNSHQ